MKVALVCSVGGHVAEMLAILGDNFASQRFWILNDESPVLPQSERSYRIAHAERDPKVLLNIYECACILAHESPDVLISTGAGPAVPAALVARLFGIPVIYIETAAAVTQVTLTGKLMRPFANRFYVQWASLQKRLPRALFRGSVF